MTDDTSGGWAQLKEQGRELDDVRAGLQELVAKPTARRHLTVGQLSTPGGTGVANETLLFDVSRADGTTEGLVARLATPDPLYLDYDLSMHYRMYEAMMAVPAVPTPAVIGYESDASIVGSEFFVMEKIDGAIPTDSPSWGAEGFVVDASSAQRRRLWERTVGLLAEMHRLDAERFAFLRTGAANRRCRRLPRFLDAVVALGQSGTAGAARRRRRRRGCRRIGRRQLPCRGVTVDSRTSSIATTRPSDCSTGIWSRWRGRRPTSRGGS